MIDNLSQVIDFYWSINHGRWAATQGELVFGQAVFLPSPRPHPLARFVNPQPGPDLATRIHDGDLITSSVFFDPASNRLRAG